MKRYVYMVINPEGNPLVVQSKNKDELHNGMLWFFQTKKEAIAYIQGRNRRGFDMLRPRRIIRVDWKTVYQNAKMVWIQV